MSKYYILDNELVGFMEWTHDEPLTKKEMINHFWDYDECRTIHKKDFTLEWIEDNWNVEIKSI